MAHETVLILYNEPRGSSVEHAESDAGVLEEVAHVATALEALGVSYRVSPVRTLRDVGQTLKTGAARYVVNLVESLEGPPSDFCLVPAVCTTLGKAWSGSGTQCQFLALDKWQSKCALHAGGIAVPRAMVIPPGRNALRESDMPPPFIVKPLCADASEGIDAESVIMDSSPGALRKCVRRIHDRFGQSALVERYLAGREFNVSILERNGELTVLPLAEIDFSAFPANKPRIVDYRAKWIEDSFEYKNTPRSIPADVDRKTARRIRDTALAAWKCLGCRDFARIDMRLSNADKPFVMEVNPNPDISPEAGFTAALQAGGLSFTDFVRILLDNAGVPIGSPAGCAPVAGHGDAVQIRWSLAADRESILDLVSETGVFRPTEIEVAAEVIDEALKDGRHGHYQSYTALHGGQAVGWVCFGPTPCTVGTFDIYWLAVHPEYQGEGVATALLARAEADVRARGGRLIVVETSSRGDYEPARRFYEHHGYSLAGRIADFYERGDDKLVYAKVLEAATQS